MDLNVDLVQQSAPHIKHAAKHVAHVAPIIKQGFSMLNLIISNIVSVAIGGGIGWYVKGRGLQGVKNDAANAVTTTENVLTAAKTAA
jgi:hypothetical protein